MNSDFKQIANYWKSSYCDTIEQSGPYQNKEEFRKMARLMAPGRSYYYIANFHTLEFEMMSESVFTFLKDIWGGDTSKVKMDHILSLALPEEIEKIHRKEQVIREFMMEYLPADQVPNYKVLYTYVLRDYKDSRRVMLHQATPLSQDDKGQFVHVFSMHTDITHLTKRSAEEVSFLNLEGGKSFLNVSTESGTFDPEKLTQQRNILEDLSNREVEIIKKLAKGANTQEISDDLFISTHTVQTHRKNILRKTGLKNTTQLVSKCIAAGIVVPEL